MATEPRAWTAFSVGVPTRVTDKVVPRFAVMHSEKGENMSDTPTRHEPTVAFGDEDDCVEDTLPGDDVQAPAEGPEPLARGANVGRYTVLERIGSGGMGVVYSAFDPQLDRRIALKVMHPGSPGHASPSGGPTRLMREAQSMARLSHPNVITVHDVGTFGERVFVAMEFIDGSTLREWLRNEDLEWMDVVDAFVRAGRGLAAAHAAGLVHRDFKPDNVLMGTDGRVLVMDFGLAREAAPRTRSYDPEVPSSEADTSRAMLQDVVLTRTGALLGTPAYMAPEQHNSGRVGPLSDQFSFCVALYEGLYGERPFAGNNVASLAMSVLEGDIRQAPRDSRVPAWLRSAVLRGLKVDPQDRYPSMDALLAELQRDPPAPRRPWVTAGAATGATLLVGTVYLLVPGRSDSVCDDAKDRFDETWDEPRRDKVRNAMLAHNLAFQETTWKSVANLLDEYRDDWTTAYIKACKADRAARRSQPKAPEHRGLACLEGNRAEFTALIDSYVESDSTVLVHAVDAAQMLPRPARCQDLEPPRQSPASARPADEAQINSIRAKLATARAQLHTGQHRAALDTATPLVREAQRSDDSALEAQVLLTVALAQARTNAPGAAERSLRRAILAAADARRGDIEAQCWAIMVDVVGLGQSAADEGQRLGLGAEAAIRRWADDPLLRADLLSSLGSIQQSLGRSEEALEHFERALELRRQNLPATHLSIAHAQEGVGLALESVGRFGEALEQHHAALTTREQILGAQHPEVGTVLIRLGSAQYGEGRLGAAEASLIRARMILDPAEEISLDDLPPPNATAPAEPTSAPAQHVYPGLAPAMDELGLLYRARLNFGQAARWHARAAALLDNQVGPDHRDVAYPIENLGLALFEQGRVSDALPHLRRALQIWNTTLDANHPDLGIAHLNLAGALWASGDLERARGHYADALNVWEETLPSDHALLGYALTGLGRIKLSTGDTNAALQLLERAMKIRDDEQEDQVNVAETALLLGQALWLSASGEEQRAIELAQRSRDIMGAEEPSSPEGLRSLLEGEGDPGFADQLRPAGLGTHNRRVLR